ncbi:MAG TPA: hypothetical protein ENF45_01250 [Bacteroidetes bacterium]|nr:hypothetical protein [Bacteroidota bacterium]
MSVLVMNPPAKPNVPPEGFFELAKRIYRSKGGSSKKEWQDAMTEASEYKKALESALWGEPVTLRRASRKGPRKKADKKGYKIGDITYDIVKRKGGFILEQLREQEEGPPRLMIGEKVFEYGKATKAKKSKAKKKRGGDIVPPTKLGIVKREILEALKEEGMSEDEAKRKYAMLMYKVKKGKRFPTRDELEKVLEKLGLDKEIEIPNPYVADYMTENPYVADYMTENITIDPRLVFWLNFAASGAATMVASSTTGMDKWLKRVIVSKIFDPKSDLSTEQKQKAKLHMLNLLCIASDAMLTGGMATVGYYGANYFQDWSENIDPKAILYGGLLVAGIKTGLNLRQYMKDLKAPSPGNAIVERMTKMGFSQTELADILPTQLTGKLLAEEARMPEAEEFARDWEWIKEEIAKAGAEGVAAESEPAENEISSPALPITAGGLWSWGPESAASSSGGAQSSSSSAQMSDYVTETGMGSYVTDKDLAGIKESKRFCPRGGMSGMMGNMGYQMPV